jgi:hypothetical protein
MVPRPELPVLDRTFLAMQAYEDLLKTMETDTRYR